MLRYSTNFPEYNPPSRHIGTTSKYNIEWNQLLSIYKSQNIEHNNLPWIYAYINSTFNEETIKLAVIIYDRYPKASKHLLLLPLINFANCPREFKKEHLSILKMYHSIAKDIARDLSSKYDISFTIGYHKNPSMNDLHIHIISNDIFEKYKKSFSFPNFLSHEYIESELENNDSLEHIYTEKDVRNFDDYVKKTDVKKNDLTKKNKDIKDDNKIKISRLSYERARTSDFKHFNFKNKFQKINSY